MPLSAYAKAIASFVATLAAAFVAANTDMHITALELQQLAVLAVTSAAVLIVPNLPQGIGRYAKQGLAFLGAAVTAALPIFQGAANLNDWILAILAGLAAIGVAGLPNTGYEYQPRHQAQTGSSQMDLAVIVAFVVVCVLLGVSLVFGLLLPKLELLGL